MLLSASTGEPVTGLTIANLDATYTRTRSAAVKNDLTALGSASAAHADNQAIEVDATNAPGLYRIDYPDAAFALGAAFVTLTINGAAIKPAHQKFALPVNTAEDIYTRLGAPAGASVSADVAAVKADSAAILVDTAEIGAAGAGLTAVPWNPAWDAEVQSEVADALVAYDPPTNAELEVRTLPAADYATAAALATVDTVADAILVDTGTDIPATLATLATAAALAAVAAKTDALPSDPADQSLVIAATNALAALLGTPAGASLSADLAALKVVADAVLADTGTDGVVVASGSKSDYRLSATGVNDILRTALTEGYAAEGAAFTLEQAMHMLVALLFNRSVSGTTLTARRLDGSTAAMTFTLDDADAPTSQVRAT
ncbi:MAG TPA: hypothetical protein VNV16_10995 [Methylibium sp.]|nr:hypothetical protein [Methylibium sp.]